MGNGCVFLFTDLEGSTRMWERAPERMGTLVARHDQLLKEAVDTHGGRVFKTLGDGVCAVFQDPARALASALDAQRMVQREPWPFGPVAIRVSLHAGNAEERDGDFFGAALNRVARILELAHGGQILVSASVCSELNELPEGASLRALGEHRLRDLTRPETLHQLMHADLPEDFAPLRALDAMPHNLPVQLTAFLGRDRELAEVGRLVRASHLTTLTGPGGCGKTRLALHAAAELLPAFKRGAWLVELAVIADGALVVRAVASVLGVRPEQGSALVDQVADRIGDERLLLLLDNCEHLLDGVAALAHALASRCPNLRILATSREPLRTDGEAVYALGPLALPGDDERRTVGILAAPACSLFVELARAADYAFSVDDAGARGVAAICRALDGIPLALELAAACTRRMSLGDLERGIAHRFEILRRGSRSALPHHRTLEATLDWSYELLTAGEQSVFCRLSVFAGGWTLESLDRVLGAGAARAHERLVDHSLVERRGDRYRYLESVRAYAAARLAADPDGARETRERHAKFGAELILRSRGGLYTAEARTIADEVESEIDNLRAGLEWMLVSESRFEDGLGAAADFWVFCWIRGYMPEGRRWLDRFLAHPAAAGAEPAVRGRALYAAGVLAKESGDLPGARGHYEQAIALHERDGIGESLFAATLSALANVARIEGDLDRAAELYEESIERNRALGAWQSVAGALHGLGRLEIRRGRLELARDKFRESLAVFRDRGDTRGEVIALSSLGDIERRLDSPVSAYRLLREGFRICRKERDRHNAIDLVFQLARVARDLGRPVRARRLVRSSLAMAWRLRAMPGVRNGLAALSELTDDPERSDKLAGAAHNLSESLDNDSERRTSAAFEAGRAMEIEAALAYALGAPPR